MPSPTAFLLARESRVDRYATGRTVWTEVHALAAGSFTVTRGWEEFRGGERDYDWTTETFATRERAFASAGITDPEAAQAEAA